MVNVILATSTDDGRSTWLIGNYNGTIELFVSLYAPNSGMNLEFYISFFRKLSTYTNTYNIDNVYILGDLNLIMKNGCSIGRKTTRYERKVVKYIEGKLKELCLSNLLTHNSNVHTWTRQGICSTLDYIFGPKHIANLQPQNSIEWGIDKSDHACILVHIDDHAQRGPGMLRPNLAFLESPELKKQFITQFENSLTEVPPGWDPHKILEYSKVMIRTIVCEISNKYRKHNSDQIHSIRKEITNINTIKASLLSSQFTLGINSLMAIESDLQIMNNELENLLIIQTQILSQKSRIKWLELGEKSNKYFLNINKSFQNKSYYQTLIHNDEILTNHSEKLEAVFQFYSSLYSKNNSLLEPSLYLQNTQANAIAVDHTSIYNNFDKTELHKNLKKCGNTASGPDGIGYLLLKTLWSSYSDILMNSWRYAP